ncbi:hypothetical protein FJT64_021634 [Amphibalanus amphitrite]|uniref:Uncharacterized protein n=1 Tax=Amphibalanus amphitrite TaxID=1232801 RepID=A0A6A4WXU6_AMPAM|nr:hypothetical protein FJT64_021634 [Amphibalanus amphitrite]
MITLLPDQRGGAAARVKLDTQRNGLGSGSAASVGRSDVDAGLNAASSQGDAITETRSTGEATTEADATGKGETLGEGSRTDAKRRLQLRHHQRRLSSGSGGSRAAGRGRGAAFGSDTTSLSGSQTRSDVIGDGQARSVETGGAAGQKGDGISQTQATSKGKVHTLGNGASGDGETSAKGTAGTNSTTSSDSTASNRLKATRGGVAESDVFTTGLSELGMDSFTKGLAVKTKSVTTGEQTTAGSARAKSNGASAVGSTLLGAGAAITDTTFRGESVTAGSIKGALQSSGVAGVADGQPVVQGRRAGRRRRQHGGGGG